MTRIWNTSDATVTADGVRYARGEHVVLEHVDLRAVPGQVTAVIGPAGSGRTTLMGILGATLRPDGGTVRLAGLDPVADPAAARSLVGAVSEIVSVWEYLSCAEVLDTLARGHRLARRDRGHRTSEALEMTGLAGAGELQPEHLDLTGKRRFGLAAALVHDPPILLLDSLTCGLDPDSRSAVLRIVRDQADAGRTVVITGTDVAEFTETADTAVFVQGGRTGPARSLSSGGNDVRPPVDPPTGTRPASVVGPRTATEELR